MVRRCPICNTSEGKLLKHMKMEIPESVHLPKSYDIAVCDKCGFTYAKLNGVTQENYNEYYSKNNDYSDEKLRTNLNNELNLARVNLIQKYISTDDKILDIGCGNGDFLVELKKSNYKNLQGIDPSADSVEAVKRRGINAQTGNIFDEGPENEKYDLICCTAVLEHIYDLNGCIEKLKGRLKGVGSRIFVDVPGMEGINEYITVPAEHFNCEHINYFTFQSLDNLFIANGFKRVSKQEDYYIFLKEKSVPILDIGAIYEMDEASTKVIEKDTKTAETILQYFSTVEKKILSQNESLGNILEKEDKVVVWGGGNYAFQMLSSVPEIREKINFFVDSNQNKVGRKIAGKEIKSIDAIPDDGTLVIVCSMNYSKEMAEKCEQQGIRYYIY